MSPAFEHFLDSALSVLGVLFLIVTLYRFWPRKRPRNQVFVQTARGGSPAGQASNDMDSRSRIVLCLFISGVLCLVLGSMLRRFLPPARPQAVQADIAPAPPRKGPRIKRSSAARFGDSVTIVCGNSPVCGIAATAQTAQGLEAHPAGVRGGVRIKSGTEAFVTLYDPEYAQTDTAEVYVVTGIETHLDGWVPGKWMHKITE